MYKKIVFTVMIILFLGSSANALDINIAYEDKEQPPYYMGNTSKVLTNNPGVAVEMIMMLGDMLEGVKIKLPYKTLLLIH